MNKRHLAQLVLSALTGILASASCDQRNSIDRSKPEVTFSADFIAVRDFSLRKDIAQARFLRNGSSFDGGMITVGRDTLLSQGSGNYYSQKEINTLLPGLNQVSFSSPEDTYLKSIAIEFPDSFGLTVINPQDNTGATSVQLQWTQPTGATKVALVVVSKNYPTDTTVPFMVVLDGGTVDYIVPDTTFDDPSGFIVDGIYYIYLAAFNQGFGEYGGLTFPLPSGLPRRAISDPAGYLRYGTVAPVDSIIVRP